MNLPLYLDLLSFMARETEHSQDFFSATGSELTDNPVSFMRCLSPFLMYFVARSISVRILVFCILHSLTPRPFGKRGFTKLLRYFHMDWDICIFILERITEHLRENLMDTICL